jgi:hypothetical protein
MVHDSRIQIHTRQGLGLTNKPSSLANSSVLCSVRPVVVTECPLRVTRCQPQERHHAEPAHVHAGTYARPWCTFELSWLCRMLFLLLPVGTNSLEQHGEASRGEACLFCQRTR